MAPAEALARLDDFVDWRPWLWSPAVRWLLREPERLEGRRVLDLGCRYGKMSCLFGLLGAEVLGIDTDAAAIPRAEAERDRWQLDSVQFTHYDGDLEKIDQRFDFIFTKSVLVVVPDLPGLLRGISSKLVPGGELLAVENDAGGPALAFLRRHVVHREWRGVAHKLHGVSESFWQAFPETLEVIERRRFWQLVTAFRARSAGSRR